jgi:uncharacterized membrane protein
MRAKSWSFALVLTLAIGVSGYALWAYGGGVQRVPVHPEMIKVFNEHRVLITLHAVGASLALLLGPFQFLDGWRKQSPKAHRILGYLYLGPGVVVGGVAGLLLAPRAFGGMVSHLGFGLLACLWLLTAWLALVAAKGRRYADHRRWMVRNYALTFAAVTLRIYLPLAMAAGLPFEAVYPTIAWCCWVPNLIAVEWFGLRKTDPRGTEA